MKAVSPEKTNTFLARRKITRKNSPPGGGKGGVKPLDQNTALQKPAFPGRNLIIAIMLCLGTFMLYSQVTHFDFINYDDTDYVSQNPHIQNGINIESITWAFTAFHAGNWHPLTWISHMLDYEIYGLDPGGHHLTSLIFHILNTLLLFAILFQMTGRSYAAGFAAALFALHPLHVESVAWVSERKDVLSAFFGLLTIRAYIRYVLKPAIGRYLMVMIFFALGLMSKPMLVTLPFLLLLLDYWPLNRFGHSEILPPKARIKIRPIPPRRPHPPAPP